MGLLSFFRKKKKAAFREPVLKEIFQGFQQVLIANNETLSIMGQLEEKLSQSDGFDLQFLRSRLDSLDHHVSNLVTALQRMSGGRWHELEKSRLRLKETIQQRLEERPQIPPSPLLVRLAEAPPEMRAALGGKAANLARVIADINLPVPDGVVATLAAYRLFMEQKAPAGDDTLLERLQKELAALDLKDEAGTEEAAARLQALVLTQPLPPELAAALVAESRALMDHPGRRLAVRSSGAREDIAATFAGQYETFLGVAPEEVPEYWRKVVASQFSARALVYFKNQGLILEEAAMGVLIQLLIQARAAGVMFTTDPESCDPERIIVSATWGLAADLVGGEVSADEYVVDKESGRQIQASYGRKEYRLALEDGRLVRQTVAPDLVGASSLEAPDLEELARFGRVLEEHCGYPNDVEWVKGVSGKLYVVQSRHLRLPEVRARYCLEMAGGTSGAEVLLEGGRVGSLGAAAGPVFRLYGDRSLAEVPADAVLVAPRTTPQLAPVLPRIAALVTDVGSTTGHLALVAREYGIPALVDTMRAGELLPEGEVVTVDAYHGKVYRGRVEELLRYQTRKSPQLMQSPLYEKLRAVVDLVVPLTLVDRRSPGFRPENCRTYHDITRFAHEKAIQAMFGLMDGVEEGRFPALRLLKLDTMLPLNLHIIDLGGGLATHVTPVPPASITSVPMRSLWRGISHPGISWAGPVPVSVGGFLHVLAQTAIRPPERFWDKTYAIVAANYVNYSCRLGYHFATVDSFCGPDPDDNFINFAFKGGAADEPRRVRRAKLIAIILERLGFELEVFKDVVRARFRKRPCSENEERLDLLGRLMAYVRQMDMVMSNDSKIYLLAERFLAGHYDRPDE